MLLRENNLAFAYISAKFNVSFNPQTLLDIIICTNEFKTIVVLLFLCVRDGSIWGKKINITYFFVSTSSEFELGFEGMVYVQESLALSCFYSIGGVLLSSWILFFVQVRCYSF